MGPGGLSLVPHDRLTEQRQFSGADRPPEAQPQQHDLEARQERLPIGHPSSPYRDDGSRKPASLDLAQYELPLPDERDSPAERAPLAEDRSYIGPDGSWSWKDCYLAPEANRAADRGLAERRHAEGRDADGTYGDRGLTPAMRRIEAQLDCGALVEDTEEYALKEPDRFKKKLHELLRDEPDKPAEQHIDEIHDGIRYTFVSMSGP